MPRTVPPTKRITAAAATKSAKPTKTIAKKTRKPVTKKATKPKTKKATNPKVAFEIPEDNGFSKIYDFVKNAHANGIVTKYTPAAIDPKTGHNGEPGFDVPVTKMDDWLELLQQEVCNEPNWDNKKWRSAYWQWVEWVEDELEEVLKCY